MSLTLQNPDVERLARDVAARTGEQLEQAVLNALQEKLTRLSISDKLSLAAEALSTDYENDEELTAFSVLDSEAFYEEG